MAKKWIRLILDCGKDWPWIGADLVLWRKFRPPRRLGTIPYRGLVPRLSRQMALSNGMKLALDWPGLALDLLGLAQIGQLTNFPFL